MLQLSSASSALSLAVGELVLQQYRIQRSLQRGKTFQLFSVLDVNSREVKVVRVIQRSPLLDVLARHELSWLKSERNDDGRHARFIGETSNEHHIFLMFEGPAVTLQTVLASSSLSLPQRHARQIALQVLQGVAKLHSERFWHRNLSTESIELVDPRTIPEHIYDGRGQFTERTVLLRPQIRISFYGQVGLDNLHSPGADQYRAPELVYDPCSDLAKEADIFAVGCIIAELSTHKALFPPISSGPAYCRSKIMIFLAVLGSFPKHIVRIIRRRHHFIFACDNSITPILNCRVTQATYDQYRAALPLEDLLVDEYLYDLVVSMVDVDPERRLALDDMESHPYFEVVD